MFIGQPTCYRYKKSVYRLLLWLLPALTGTVQAQMLNEDSIKKVIQVTRSDSIRTESMLTYANYLLNHHLQKDSAGLYWLQEATRLAEKNNDLVSLLQAYLTTGNYYRTKNNWEKSMQAYRQMIHKAPGIPDTTMRNFSMLMAHNNLGNIFNINGDFASSLENRLKCVEIIEGMPRRVNNLATACLNAASDYRQLKQYEKAKEYMQKITPLVDSLRDDLKIEYYYEQYHLLIGSNENKKAEQVLRKVDSSIERLNLTDYDKLDFGTMANKLHGLYEMDYTGNYEQAYRYFSQTYANGLAMKNATEIASALYNMGWALYEMKRISESVNRLKQAYDSAHNNELNGIALKAAILLARAYEKVHDPARGLYYSRLAMELKDSITSADKVAQLNFLEAKYQNIKKENEIAGLVQTNQQHKDVIRRKNWIIAGSSVLLGLLLLLSVVVYRYYKNRQQLILKEKALQEEKIFTLEKQQQVISLQAMINGQETERTRIAKDLHDGLGGIFSTVKMHFSTLQHEVPVLVNNQLYRKSFELVDNASEELRKIAQNMMPEVLLKMGLMAALQDFCNNVNSARLLHISLQTYGMEKRLGASAEVMLYRIIQELINNIIKHAYATEAIIQFNKNGNRLTVTVEDNGRGFDMQEAEEKRTMGIQTVKSRVNYLNGTLSIDSRKDVGTTILIDLLVNDG